MVFGLFRRRNSQDTTSVVSDAYAERAAIVAPATDLTPAVAQPIELGPILWQNAAYGMTPQQVLETRADAERSGSPQRLHDGATSDLQICQLRLADHDYSVQFYFKNGHLTQVTIATCGGPTMSDFDAITNALRLRYGREVEFKKDASSFSTGEWLGVLSLIHI